MRASLDRGKLLRETASAEHMLMVYWIVEFIKLDRNVKK
jgi:hypothetical protein